MTVKRYVAQARAQGAHVYAAAPVLRPQAVKFSGAGPGGISIQGIEVCQSIQTVDNAVALIANKPTIVRVYLDKSSLAKPVEVRGEITVRTTSTGPATYVAAINNLRLDPQDGASLLDKREGMARSLNFRLPGDLAKPGSVIIEINRVTQTGGDDQPLTGNRTATIAFVAAPPLRIRCIGLRYRDAATGQTHTPDATHFAYLRSYLERAYPVPSVEWSHIVVDADFAAPFSDDTVVDANMQVAAIRSADVSAGTDPRTHYFGLVDDANGTNFMRGRAMGIPTMPQPDTVASGPCGVPKKGFGGDHDLSYADWYGAHELGHTFGRPHPGFPVGEQDASDPDFPYQDGQLSNADRKYVGYDLGDASIGASLQALPGTTYHDVMTYADRQWVSAHTFEAIRIRLKDEDAQFAPAIV